MRIPVPSFLRKSPATTQSSGSPKQPSASSEAALLKAGTIKNKSNTSVVQKNQSEAKKGTTASALSEALKKDNNRLAQQKERLVKNVLSEIEKGHHRPDSAGKVRPYAAQKEQFITQEKRLYLPGRANKLIDTAVMKFNENKAHPNPVTISTVCKGEMIYLAMNDHGLDSPLEELTNEKIGTSARSGITMAVGSQVDKLKNEGKYIQPKTPAEQERQQQEYEQEIYNALTGDKNIDVDAFLQTVEDRVNNLLHNSGTMADMKKYSDYCVFKELESGTRMINIKQYPGYFNHDVNLTL